MRGNGEPSQSDDDDDSTLRKKRSLRDLPRDLLRLGYRLGTHDQCEAVSYLHRQTDMTEEISTRSCGECTAAVCEAYEDGASPVDFEIDTDSNLPRASDTITFP